LAKMDVIGSSPRTNPAKVLGPQAHTIIPVSSAPRNPYVPTRQGAGGRAPRDCRVLDVTRFPPRGDTEFSLEWHLLDVAIEDHGKLPEQAGAIPWMHGNSGLTSAPP